MSGRSISIEDVFEALARAMIHWRWLIIAAALSICGLVGSQALSLRTSSELEAFLQDDDPARVLYDDFRRQFGRDQSIVIAIASPDIFTLPFLERLAALHRAIEEEVPHVEEVTSLLNARVTRGEGDVLIVEDLLADWPESGDELTKLRARVFDNPIYIDTLISSDGEITTITVKPDTWSSLGSENALEHGEPSPLTAMDPAHTSPFLTEEEGRAHVEGVEAVVERFRGERFEIHMAGGIAMGVRIGRAVQADIDVFMGLAGIVVVVGLFAVFRTFLGVVLPFVVVGLALALTLGGMAIFDIPLSITTEILPPFLLTVGVCDSVHVLVIYDRLLSEGQSRDDAIALAVAQSGSAIVMTSLTTAGGLASFSIARVAPIADLGLVAPLGVLAALLLTLTLLPALIATLPARRPAAEPRSQRPTEALLGRLADLSVARPRLVVAISFALLVLALAGASRLRFSQDELRWFPEDEPLRIDTALIDRELGGAMSLDILLRSDGPGGLHDPELLAALEHTAQQNARFQHGDFFIGKTLSIADVVKEIHRALNENRPEYYTLPDDRALIAQELLLFESSGTDHLEDFADSELRLARINARIPWADSALYPELIGAIQAQIAPLLEPHGEVELTGLSPLLGSIFARAIETLWRSYATALLIIVPLMALMLRSLRLGLISMIPNLLPIVLTLGLMGWLDLPLDMSNLLIGGIVLGIAVDDTIHFFHRFDRNHRATGDAASAIRLTLKTTGRALLFTSIVLASGFGILAFAYLQNIASFGLLAGGAVALAFLADVTLGPALLMLLYGEQRSAANGVEIGPRPISSSATHAREDHG